MKNYPLYFKPLFLLFFLLSFGFCLGQKQSKIYNHKGQLIADTTFSLSKKQLKSFVSFEDDLITQLIKLGKSFHFYPEVEYEAGMEDSLAIFRFTIGNDSIKNIEAIKSAGPCLKGVCPGMLKVVKLAMNKIVFDHKIKYDTAQYYCAFAWRIITTKDSVIPIGIYLHGGKFNITVKTPFLIPAQTEYSQTINDDASLYFDTTKCERVSVIERKDTNKIEQGEELLIFGDKIENCSMSGRVIDKITGKGIKDATIYIEGHSISKNTRYDSTWTINTDSNGKFFFERKDKLKIKLYVIQQGYECLMISGVILENPYRRKMLRIKLPPK